MTYRMASDQPRSNRGMVKARKRWRMCRAVLALEERALLSTIVVNNPRRHARRG